MSCGVLHVIMGIVDDPTTSGFDGAPHVNLDQLAQACNVGDEGGFAPNVQDNNEANESLPGLNQDVPIVLLLI